MANRWFPEYRHFGQLPSSAAAEGSPNRPPPFPPDSPNLSPFPSFSEFPPLSLISPVSYHLHSPQTDYVDPERVILALPAQHKSTPVVVNAQAQEILNSYHASLRQNPRSETRATVAIGNTVVQTDGLLSTPPPKVVRRFIKATQTASTQLVDQTASQVAPGPTVTTAANSPSTVTQVSVAPTLASNLPTPPVTGPLPPEIVVPVPQIQVPSTPTTSSLDAAPLLHALNRIPSQSPTVPPPQSKPIHSLAQKLKSVADRSLTRLAPVDFSST
ncbi:PREDICTED: mucin-7-like [Camelina sativa]|uniref:Mucin-7-like n=1 Tax=Camelina sativa TaxID=90675 RepID=A0ABM0Y4R4_CAMSA|nr:PREDICTED: mucin-7-like [Camelina sativa]